MKNPLILLLAALLVVGGMTGCAPKTKYDAAEVARANMIVDPVDAKRLGYVLRWTSDIAGIHGNKITRVAVLGDLICVVDGRDNILTALSVRDGTVLWRYQISDRSATLYEPVRDGKTVIVNSETQIFSFDAETGRLKNIANLEYSVNSAPYMYKGLAIFGGMNGRVFAHNVEEGFRTWASMMSTGIMVRPVGIENRVLAADVTGQYAMYDASFGNRIWAGRAFARISAQPVMTKDAVYIASEDQALYSVDRFSGDDRIGWPYRTDRPLTKGVSAIGNSIYLPLGDEAIICIDPLNGREVWRRVGQFQPVLLTKDNYVLLNAGRSLVLADNSNGKTVLQLPVKPLQSVLPSGENTLILLSKEGKLQRYDTLKSR